MCLIEQWNLILRSMEPVWTPWTCGSSPPSTKLRPKTEWRFVLCCWAMAPIPPCSTVTARALSTWPPPRSLRSGSPVSPDQMHRSEKDTLLSIQFLFLSLFFHLDEFKGHSLLQAAREADIAKVKKTLALEIIGFKHPQTNETALVRRSPYNITFLS